MKVAGCNGAVTGMLVFNVPYADIVKGIQAGVKREEERKNLLSVLPLVRDHFSQVAPDYVNAVGQRFYPVGRNLMVPFTPPLMYGANGETVFPWFSFWQSNPIAEERLLLFVSIMKDVLLQDPDLEKSKLPRAYARGIRRAQAALVRCLPVPDTQYTSG